MSHERGMGDSSTYYCLLDDGAMGELTSYRVLTHEEVEQYIQGNVGVEQICPGGEIIRSERDVTRIQRSGNRLPDPNSLKIHERKIPE